MSCVNEEFFLGSISPEGFQTHFNNEIMKSDYFTYILKGGCGTGKSSLIKRIADEFTDKDKVTIYRCSFDPDSLNAVKLKNAGIIIVNGSGQHTFEPNYPEVAQKIINAGDFCDKKSLKNNSSEIISNTDNIQKWNKRCYNFVNALSSLYSDTFLISQDALHTKKLLAFTERLSRKLLHKGSKVTGLTTYSQISALTPNGYQSLLPLLSQYKNVYQLNDLYYSGSDAFLRDFANIATSKGYDVIISECTLFKSKIFEHLLIPELSIAFISSNPINNNFIDSAKPVNFMRFYENNHISPKKIRLSFNKKACAELLSEASDTLKKSKEITEQVKKYYSSTMDFFSINKLTDNIISSIYEKYNNK